MNVLIEMRNNQLLQDMAKSLVDYTDAPRYISFYGSESNDPLCEMLFDSVTSVSAGGVGNVATYIFSLGTSNIIRGIVTKSGEVKTFKISGKVSGPGDPLRTEFITGTVGGMSSSADIKFNKVNWVIGKNITITNLTLIMK